jgi:hypothetical protein
MLDGTALMVVIAVAVLGTLTVIAVWYFSTGNSVKLQIDVSEEEKDDDDNKVSFTRVNVNTRGDPEDFEQLGLLYATTGSQAATQANNVLPVYGRQTYKRAHKWNYYTVVDGIIIPLEIDNADCMKQLGCNELYDKDRLNIPQLNNVYKYQHTEEPPIKYIPNV